MEANVFKDLGIDTEGLLDDPESVMAFQRRVFTVVNELEEVMNRSSNVGILEQEAIAEYKASAKIQETCKKLFNEEFEAIYNLADGDHPEIDDEPTLPEIYGALELAKTLVKDLEILFHDKAKEAVIERTSTLNDKKLAQVQHRRLREAWQDYSKFATMYFGKDKVNLQDIKAKPGNYAASVERIYYFVFPGETDGFYNAFQAAKRLGIYYEGIGFREILDYCNEHPDEITLTQVTL